MRANAAMLSLIGDTTSMILSILEDGTELMITFAESYAEDSAEVAPAKELL